MMSLQGHEPYLAKLVQKHFLNLNFQFFLLVKMEVTMGKKGLSTTRKVIAGASVLMGLLSIAMLAGGYNAMVDAILQSVSIIRIFFFSMKMLK